MATPPGPGLGPAVPVVRLVVASVEVPADPVGGSGGVSGGLGDGLEVRSAGLLADGGHHSPGGVPGVDEDGGDALPQGGAALHVLFEQGELLGRGDGPLVGAFRRTVWAR